jgi:DNA-directed RNA polymerase specialized sigma24 family protein
MVLRKRRRRAEVSFEPESESGEFPLAFDVRETALDPEQLLELRQRSECALRAIGKLTSNLRMPMTTWIELECSMKDLARTHELSLASVKSRIHRARKQLTRSMAFKERVRQAGSTTCLKCQYEIP